MTAPANGISADCVGMPVRVDLADGSHRHGVIIDVQPMPADNYLSSQYTAFVTVSIHRHPANNPKVTAWLN